MNAHRLTCFPGNTPSPSPTLRISAGDGNTSDSSILLCEREIRTLHEHVAQRTGSVNNPLFMTAAHSSVQRGFLNTSLIMGEIESGGFRGSRKFPGNVYALERCEHLIWERIRVSTVFKELHSNSTEPERIREFIECGQHNSQ
jgi:hypothetical protein